MLAILTPNVIYTARVAATPASNDGVAELSIGTESGTLSDVLDGMTVWAGSSAGGKDKGMARVRAIETGKLTIGLTSDGVFGLGDYLTIVDDMGWWSRPAVTDDSGAILLDGDITYAGQHEDWKPVVVMGPDAVAYLAGETVEVAFDASTSWVPDSTAASYAWEAPGADAVTGDDTATPTITYAAAGTYLVRCTVTASNGEANSGYRRVYVWDDAHLPVTAFQLETFSGSYDNGGWICKIKAFAGVSMDSLYDGCKVILFADERYGSFAGSIGPVAWRESVKMIGWVDGESIEIGYDRSTVTFEISGPAAWLGKLPGQGCDLWDDSETPSTWSTVEALSVDKCLASVCIWQSTAGAITDVYPSGDLRRIPSVEGLSSGMIWGGLSTLGGKIGAKPCADRYGRLFLEIDQQLISTDDRTSIPTVMDIERQDWRETVEFGRSDIGKASQVEVNGTCWSGGSHAAVRAGCGKFPGRFGQPQSLTMVFASEEDAAMTVGHLRAKLNNPYPLVYVYLIENNPLVDICPRQTVSMSLAADDTPRGIIWDAQRLIPRTVSYVQRADGSLVTDLECEGETSGTAGVMLPIPTDAPVVNDGADDYLGDADYPMVPTGSIWFPDLLPGEGGPPSSGCRDNLGAAGNGPFEVWPDKFFLTTQDADKLSTMIYYPCMIRPVGSAAETRLRIVGHLEYLLAGEWKQSNGASAWLSNALDGSGSVVLTALNNVQYGFGDRDSWFKPAAQMDVNGFKITLNQPGTEVPGAYNKLFDFADGWQGWTYEGNPVPEDVRWYNGRLEKRRARTYFKWYPDELYAATGAVVECDHGPTSWGPFSGFGVGIVNTEDPLSVSWVYTNARNYGHPSLTLGSAYNGKRIHYVQFDEGADDANAGVYPCWIDNVQLTGFTNKLAARRLNIERLELYNICRPA
jgi:hypothetical protein